MSLPAPCTRNRVKHQKQIRNIALSWRFIGSLRSGHMLYGSASQWSLPPRAADWIVCQPCHAPPFPPGCAANPATAASSCTSISNERQAGRPPGRTLIQRQAPPASSPRVNGRAERFVMKLDTVPSRPLAARRPPSVCLDPPCCRPDSCFRRRRACAQTLQPCRRQGAKLSFTFSGPTRLSAVNR